MSVTFAAPQGVTSVTVLGANYVVSNGSFTVSDPNQIARLFADGFVRFGSATPPTNASSGTISQMVGVADGVNTIFYLPFNPSPSAQLSIWQGGILQFLGTDYSQLGRQITFNLAPMQNAVLLCSQ
jgi:hypothetical protein